MPKRIVIACGGTGGHLFPGIAVAEELKRRGHEVLALISEKDIDALATQGYDHIEFRKVPAIGMPKLLSPKMVKFFFRFLKTVKTCRGILDEFRADAVLGMGGFTSMPPIKAGRKKGCRTFIHDSNAIPGKANRLTSHYTDAVLLGLDECARHFPNRETITVGTPIRPALKKAVTREEATEFFGLSEHLRTILVMGGSQGARGVNNAVCDALVEMDVEAAQIIHLCGEADAETVEAKYRESGIRHHVAPFCHRIELALTLADVCVSRAGGSSLAEIAYFGLPPILIPYPFAAEDHQLRNAEVFSRAEAAILLEQSNLSGKSLGGHLNRLLNDASLRSSMGKKAAALVDRDSAARIASIIEEKCA